jgi:hypothetical protein
VTLNLEAALPERSGQFEELHARAGARVQLVFSGARRNEPVASVLIGYLAHEFLIVKAPVVGGLAIKAQNDEWLKVRLFTGVFLAEFDTSVQRQFVAPVSYWHLAYPEAVRISMLRAARRAQVDLTAHVDGEGQQSAHEVRLVDLSELGARIVAPSALGEPGSVIRLGFSLPRSINGDSTPVSVAARIKAVKLTAGEGDTPSTHAHGVQFEDLGESDRLRLQNFVLLRLNDGRARGV